MTVMIINNKNKIFEYTVDDITDAINLYIEEELGYNKYFSMNEATWQYKICGTVSDDLSNLITLVNGLCTKNSFDIVKVISGYTVDYSKV
jgi:hypothetical protein